MPSLYAKFAGVLPPTEVPKFTIKRSPLWVPNNRVSGVANAEADPIFGTNGTQNTVYHYQTDGNAYLRQTWDNVMAWEQHATTPANADVFAFKCLIRPHEVHGRRLIYSTKGSLKSGGIFIDMVDGRARVGWYDTVQKREVWIETNVPVFEPYHWHYLYVRKRYPDTTLGSGCWTDTVFDLTSASLNDVLLVRRFPKATTVTYQKRTWDYKPSGTVRNFIGFTTDLEYSVASSPSTGLVSRATRTFTGAPAGAVTASAAIYSADMVGMKHYFVTGVPGVYVISAFGSSTTCTVVDPVTGVAPDMTALAGSAGGVYTGVRLIKSDGFNTSESVDQTSYDIELFGSHLAAYPETGILPFVGEFASFAYTVVSGATPDVFESGAGADRADDGADLFGNVNIYDASATSVGMLHADSGITVFTAVDVQAYGAAVAATSSLPNEKLEVAVNTTISSARARNPVWKFLYRPTDLGKPRRVRVAFYDPDQAQVSQPSPELLINPGGDDASNPSGSVSIALSQLPVSRDRGDITTRIYMTLPDGADYRQVAEVPNGTSSVVVTKTDSEIGRGELLEFDNWPPPECDVIEVSQDSLVCGSLRRWFNSDGGVPQDVPDVAVFSKSFRPSAFPADNIVTVPDGSRPGVTGMRDFNGRLFITKRDSCYQAVLRQGAAQREIVSSRIGAASGAALVMHDNALLFWGKRGIYGHTGAGVPEWISGGLEHLFAQDEIEPGAALKSVACSNARRDQILFTLQEADAPYTSHRISAEWSPDDRRWRFSRYEGPNLTALADFARDTAEIGSLVGGTEEGFFVWLDRSDTPLLMLGPTAAIHGDSALTVGASATTTAVPVSSGALDTSLATSRGAVLTVGSESATVLFAASGTLYLDRPLTAAPSNGASATLGRATRVWETKWLDFADFEFNKKGAYIDILTTIGSGTITATGYKDFGATSYPLKPHPNATASTIDVSQHAVSRFDIGHLQGRHLKFRFESSDLFEIVSIVVRVADADQF